MNHLRPGWQKMFPFNWRFGLALILLFGIPRFVIVLNANVTGNYNLVSIIFLLMWIAPFVFLTKKGRSDIGIRKPQKYSWLLYSFLIGIAACTIVYFIGDLLFADSIKNWFVYISNSYRAPLIDADPSNKYIYFIMFASIGMTFSPIGEELLYRGLIHGCFSTQLGENKASIIDSLAFAITRLAHFGIVYVSSGWNFLFYPAILWVVFMFLTSRLFFMCKVKSGSIYGAIISHAGFNLAMTYYVFYFIF